MFKSELINIDVMFRLPQKMISETLQEELYDLPYCDDVHFGRSKSWVIFRIPDARLIKQVEDNLNKYLNGNKSII